MSRSHTQSLVRQVGSQLNARDFRAICPVIFNTDALSSAGLFGVKGTAKRNGGALDFENRWATLTKDEVVGLLNIGTKDGTAHQCRVVSHIAGNRYGAGSEDAILIELTGSKEAEALAKELGVNYSMTVTVGQEGIQVTHTNPVIVTLAAANEAMGYLQVPSLEKGTRRSRADQSNPSLQAALAYADANGNQLPARQTAAPANRVDDDFAALFPNAGKRPGRQYNAAPSDEPDF